MIYKIYLKLKISGRQDIFYNIKGTDISGGQSKNPAAEVLKKRRKGANGIIEQNRRNPSSQKVVNFI